MIAKAKLSTASFDEFSWIRPEGKGNFLISPALKICAETEFAKGCSHLVVDLELCPSIDSTFMGTLATLAKTIRKTPGGTVEIADANSDNERALKDLGLTHLLKINPENPDWEDRKDDVRAALQPDEGLEALADKGQYVLQAHKELVRANPQNKSKFSTLISMLESDQAAKSTG